MLDLLGIVFSSIMMFLVILRAIQLDSLELWYRPPKTGVDQSGLKLRPDNHADEAQPAWRSGPRRG